MTDVRREVENSTALEHSEKKHWPVVLVSTWGILFKVPVSVCRRMKLPGRECTQRGGHGEMQASQNKEVVTVGSL